MTVVGEAEIVILANTSGFKKSLESSTGSSFSTAGKLTRRYTISNRGS